VVENGRLENDLQDSEMMSHKDEDISKCTRWRTNYVNGFDKSGRPIIYLKKRADKKEKPDFAAGLRLLVHSVRIYIHQFWYYVALPYVSYLILP